MKAFKFTLQTLLNVKKTLEKQQMAELADCNARIRALMDELAVIEEAELRQQTEYKDKMLAGEMRVSELPTWNIAFKAIRERAVRQKQRIEAAEADRERIQKKIVETMRERKALENLKEKQFEEYRAEVRAEDAAAMDDFLSNKLHTED